MWTIHQPPSRVTSISLDIGPISDEGVGDFTHKHEIGKAPVQRFVRSSDSRPPWPGRWAHAPPLHAAELAAGPLIIHPVGEFDEEDVVRWHAENRVSVAADLETTGHGVVRARLLPDDEQRRSDVADDA